VIRYRVALAPDVASGIAQLPPDLKRAVRSTLGHLEVDPAIGEPLLGELAGRFKVRVRRYRIVYRVDRAARQVRVVAFGHRRSIYEELARKLKQQGDA
jgi:mRNA interferase RelE/StbE